LDIWNFLIKVSEIPNIFMYYYILYHPCFGQFFGKKIQQKDYYCIWGWIFNLTTTCPFFECPPPPSIM
jgi:hypothetical protein